MKKFVSPNLGTVKNGGPYCALLLSCVYKSAMFLGIPSSPSFTHVCHCFNAVCSFVPSCPHPQLHTCWCVLAPPCHLCRYFIPTLTPDIPPDACPHRRNGYKSNLHSEAVKCCKRASKPEQRMNIPRCLRHLQFQKQPVCGNG